MRLALLLACLPAAPAALAQDVDPPVIRVLESGSDLQDGRLFNRSVVPVIEVTDASPVAVEVSLDGVAFTSGGTVVGQGAHLLSVSATDDAENSASLTIAFEIDTVPPAFGSLSPADGSLTAAAEITLTGEVAGADAVTVDGQPASLAGGSFSAGPFPLAEGVRTFSVVASDAAGNSATRAHRVVRDSTPPQVAISQPAADAVVGTSPVDVVGSVADPHLAGVTVNGTAAAVTGGTFVARNVPLAEGATPLVARATDRAGNASEAQRSVVLDTLPPAVSITDPAAGTVTPAAVLQVSGSAGDPHLARVEVNGVAAQLSGASWSAAVALAEGNTDLTATAWDALGRSASDTVSVVRDSTAPEVRITTPADGAHLAVESVEVAGTVGDEADILVTVNGAPAAVGAGSGGTAPWSLAGVPLIEGENRLVARVVDPLGNQGAHTRLVYRDTVAPELLAAEPADGALAVPPSAAFELTFSEELAPPAVGSWRLELADGTPLAAAATLAGEVLAVRPDAPLPSGAELRLILTAALADRAGNALAGSATLVFTVADVEAPTAPVLSAAPPSHLCAPRLTLSGTAEPEATVRAAGGAAGAEARAAEDGTFTLAVDLRPSSLNRVELTVRDRDGNLSAPLAVVVIQDCAGPVVLGAERSGDTFIVRFDEAVEAASLALPDGLVVRDAGGPLAGAVAASPDGTGATFTATAPLPATALRLEVGSGVRDLAGNPLAFPYSEVFGAEVAPSFLAGRVLDAATGRPLSGARVVVLSTDGATLPEPRPEQTTGADGRFRVPVAAGTHYLAVGAVGHTPVMRLVASTAGLGSDVFDPRLTRMAEAAPIGPAGGAFVDPARPADGPVLELPAAALAAEAAVSVTALDEQALPALLPYGWSPRGAAWVDLGGAILAAAGSLSFPVDVPDGTPLVVAALDTATLQWSVVAEATVFEGAVSVSADGEGAWVAVQPDLGVTAPPAAVVGVVLGSSPAPIGDEALAAAVVFDPALVLPSQSSRATVTYTLGTDAASGLAVTVSIREELTLLDGTVRTEAPYDTDLVVYRAPDGTPRSRFRLRPSEQAARLPLQVGAEEVAVHRYAGATVRGNVLGPLGGTVTNPEGDRVDLPVGAVPEPTPVLLERLEEGDLPVAVPVGFAFLGHLELDLSGRILTLPATLTLELGAAPAPGEEGLLFHVVEVAGTARLRPVAALAATASGWTTAAIDPQDLPWPGVRASGRYLFARRTTDLAFLRGGVHGVGGGLAPGLLVTGAVDGTALEWVQVSNEAGDAAGRYVLPAPLGAAVAVATDLASGDSGNGAALLAVAGERVDLDLLLQLTGPRVVEMVPTDGATNVAPGVEPTVRFDEDVDPVSLATGILLYRGTELVTATLERQGTLVRIVPQATLLPGTTYELRVTTALRDLHGNRLPESVSATFTVREEVENDGLDRRRIHLFAPDADGDARVLGRSGAVPAGSLVFVENVTSFVATPSVTAAADGSFDIEVAASLDDDLLLHVVIEGQNEVVWELTPFLSSDGRGAHVGRDAATFTTLDDVTIEVERGTFLDPGVVVRVEPRPAVSPAPVPADFSVLAAFELDFGGAEAQKALGVSLPTPAGLTGDQALLTRIWRVLGADRWMLHDLMRRDGDRLTTEPPPEEDALAALGVGSGPSSGARVASLSGLGSAVAAPQEGAPSFLAAPSRMGDRQEYLPGSANPGLYVVMENQTYLDFVVFPFLPAQYAWYEQNRLDGMILAVNAHIERLLAFDGILMPTRRGLTYTVVGRELDTGFRFFEGTFEPPAADSLEILPPDLFGDTDRPFPVAGSPLRFFAVNPARAAVEEIALDIEMELVPADGLEPARLVVTGAAGAADPEVGVQLLGLEDAVGAETTSAADGSFGLDVEVEPGHRYLLALGALVGSRDPLEITFSEGLGASAFTGGALEVRDSRGLLALPRMEPVGTAQTLRISPHPAWKAGERYTLTFKPWMADAAGNEWEETLQVGFRVAASREIDTFGLPEVRDVERVGGLLFVAAGEDGLVVLDAADPANLANAIEGDLRFPFPLADPVTALAVDPHGRVLVAGGGVHGFGQLKVFDPQLFDPVAIAADPGDAAVRYAAFRGSTVVSDSPTSGTSLPEGQPRHLAVLSDDERDGWRIGLDAPPPGVTLSPAEPPALGPWTVTLSGSDGTPGQAVTVRNLTRGRWSRTDADGAGAWSASLVVEPGDRVEVLRNRQTLAYLATLGVGIQVVDVNGFYGEGPEEWDDPDPLSDVAGVYTGFGDPSLRLCNEPISDIGTSLLDLGTLSGDAAHPLTLVGLIAFRGLGMFESDPADVGSISFYGDACARLGGTAHVFGLDVAEDYPFDLDGDGQVGEDELRDYVVVTHRTQGVLVFDATNRENLELAGHVRIDGQAERVTVDQERRRLYVSAAGGGLHVVDFDLPPDTDPLDLDHDLVDDRVLEILALPGNTNAETFLFPELGLAFAGGLDRGLTTVAVGGPRLAAVVDAAGGAGDGAGLPRFRTVSRLAPLGVPTAPASPEPGAPDLPGAFRVLAALPGVVGDEVRLDLVSLESGGLPIQGAGGAAPFAGLPAPALTGADGLLFRRLAQNPWEEGHQLFLSEEVAAVADLRAARDYQRTDLEDAACVRCDHDALGVSPVARQILSGTRIAVRFPASLRAVLAGAYDPRTLDLAEVTLESVPWEISPSVRQEPLQNPALSQGDAVPGTLLHSGEMTLGAVDLTLRGRGLDFAFQRTYRSQTVGAGPLGPGWDHAYRQRLRALPNGDVELYDGSGRREVFRRRADGGYDPPPGRFADLHQSLARTSAGWLLVTAHRVQLRFDVHGRLLSISDPSKDAEETGNQLRFRYDLASRLVQVLDSLDRPVSLAYDGAGRLATVTDFSGRTVTYGYDAQGRLSGVTSPAVTVGVTTFPAGLTTGYAYEGASGGLSALLNAWDNLSGLTDPRGTTRFTLGWSDADGDGRAEEVTSQQWGSGTVQLAYDFDARTTVVTDRREHERTYGFDAEGHLTLAIDPLGNAYTFTYDGEGNLTSQESPLGTRTQLAYATGGDPRSRGNVQQVRVDPGSLGRNGSAEFLTTAVQHDPATNRPSRVTDPRGTVTAIERNFAGLPERIRQAVGTDEAAETAIEYDEHGRPTLLEDATGRRVALAYYESGPMQGYLARRTVDPSGLGLTTTFEYDERGNVVAETGPRGVRHEWVYNEVDWVVEERRATTPSRDGAGPLTYVTRYLHDENGNVVEQRLPFGDGTTFTRVRTLYGPLDQVLRVSAERSEDAWVEEIYGYDANLNLTQVTSPAGEITRHHFDPRNLPVRTEVGLPQFDPPLEVVRTYDAEGRLKTELDPLGRDTELFYDGYQRPRSTVDALGNETRVVYDDGGNPLEIQRLDAADCLLALSRATYDPLGRPATQTGFLWEYPAAGQPCTALPGDARTVTESFVYDAAGRLLRRIDPLGRTSLVTYDGAGRPRLLEDPAGNLLESIYDAAGNVIREETTEQAPDGSTVMVVVEHRYDALGRRIATEDALGNETRWIHDARGNVRGVLDAEGYLTEHTYDGLDRRTSTTQPEGLRVELEYDEASRPTVYRDALGNETTWAYDDLGRMTSVTFEDGTTRAFQYDGAGNPTRVTDPRGTVIDQVFDDLNRLTSRAVAPSPGVEGITAQTFAYDGLGRLVRAVDGGAGEGPLAVDLAYDSLSRQLAETTAGRTLRFAYDDAGNEIGLEYPSGFRVGRLVDALDRPSALGSIAQLPTGGAAPQLGERVVGYAYRGPALLAEKVLGPQVSPVATGRMSYDPARRLLSTVYEDATLEAVYAEALTWTPRSLKASQARPDLAERTTTFTYDGASRVLAATRSAGPAATVLPEQWGYTYDAAQNLLARAEATPWGSDLTALPLDGSGRNRPASVDGVVLEYDAAGNLTRKGDRTLHYDAFNRLVRVADGSGTVATYRYDALNRRIEATVGGTTRTTTWAGWQALEERTDGTLAERRTFGLGLDEVVLTERDTNGDGVPDQRYRPLFDSIGNVALLLDESGTVIERYDYSPFGERWVEVNDLTAPQVEQVRVENGALVLELSEEVSEAALAAAETAGLLVLEETATSAAVPFAWSLPVTEGRVARRRLVLTPDTVPAGGTELRLALGAGALSDLFGNANAAPHEQVLLWQDGVVTDTAAPELLVVALVEGHLRVTFSEPVDLATATTALLLDGAPSAWTATADLYTLETDSALPSGSHTLRIETTLTDLASQPLAVAFETTFEAAADHPDRLIHLTADPHLLTTSTVGNRYGFHGRPVDPETGLMYFRNRYYDPEMGRFVTTDPLGYVDGPNLYQYGLNNPASFSDPVGLCVGAACADLRASWEPLRRKPQEEELSDEAKSFGGLVVGIAESAGKAVVGFLKLSLLPVENLRQGASDFKRLKRAYDQGGVDGFLAEDEVLRHENRERAKQQLLGLPVVNTLHQGSRVIGTYQQEGPFEGGRQLGRTIFSVGEDAALAYGSVRATGRSISRGAVGFAPGEGASALTANRLQHGTRHLSEAGVLPAWRGSTSPRLIRDTLSPVLERPLATFDDVLRGGARVKGFLGEINGQQVALLIYKEGPLQGQLATSFVPSASQLAKWGVP